MKHLLLIVSAALSFPALAAGNLVEIPGKGITLKGHFFASEAADPRPAIVMLHGCSGMLDKGERPTEAYAFWAQHFQRLGYTTLLLDSFSPRGSKEICTQRHRGIRPDKERTEDAHAALAWMAKQSQIDADRIHLMGWSNGAMTVLHAIKPNAAGRNKAHSFRSAVAFYPGCAAVLKEAEYSVTTPLLIQSGGADDWTPAAHCEKLVAQLKTGWAKVELDVYPGAHHGFDRANFKSRFRPDVRNTSSPTGWGATIAGHPEARAKAIARTTAFFQEQNR